LSTRELAFGVSLVCASDGVAAIQDDIRRIATTCFFIVQTRCVLNPIGWHCISMKAVWVLNI